MPKGLAERNPSNGERSIFRNEADFRSSPATGGIRAGGEATERSSARPFAPPTSIIHIIFPLRPVTPSAPVLVIRRREQLICEFPVYSQYEAIIAHFGRITHIRRVRATSGGFLKQIPGLLHFRGEGLLQGRERALSCQITCNIPISLIYCNFTGDFEKRLRFFMN